MSARSALYTVVRTQHLRARIARHQQIAAFAIRDVASSPKRAFRSRKNAMPNRLIRMFSGVENCWRIEAAESVVADWA